MNFQSKLLKGGNLIILLPVLFLVTNSVFLNSCALFPRKIKSDVSPQLLLTLQLNAINYYQPGEAALCTVRLINITGQPKNLQSLNAQSLTFWQGVAETEEVKKIEPVFSKKENMLEFVKVEPYDYIERTFLFTKLTETSGTLTLQGIYEGVEQPLKAGSPKPIQAISRRLMYEVRGERKFKRDRDGILLKEEAIKLVREKINEQISAISAHLIVDEPGFLNWWVTYSIKNLAGKEVRRGCLVNPYLGVIRREVPPYEPEPEKKPPLPFKPSQRFGGSKK